MASDFETVIAKCDGCKYEEECREMPPCILDAYNKGRADVSFEEQYNQEWLSKHDKQIRANAIDEFLDKLPYSALVRFSTIRKIAEQLKEQNK